MIALGCLARWPLRLRLMGPDAPFRFFESEQPGERHRRRASILYCDGHASGELRTRLIEKTDSTRRRWNRDHEPHPETWR
jgi:prepilin-type processing-associated H-X9-DG protein